MTNEEYLQLLAYIGTSGTVISESTIYLLDSTGTNQYQEQIEQMQSITIDKPFLVKVELTQKGIDMGVEEFRDGFYLNGVRLSDKWVLGK